jgi:hypothetical protein
VPVRSFARSTATAAVLSILPFATSADTVSESDGPGLARALAALIL